MGTRIVKTTLTLLIAALICVLMSACNTFNKTEAVFGKSFEALSSSSTAAQPLTVAGDSSGEQAVQADNLADSVGVNTHFDYGGTFYTTEVDVISNLLIESGVRHIRDGGPGKPDSYYQQINSLYTRAGIRNIGGLGTGDEPTLAAEVAQMFNSMPHIEGFESLNEWDANGGASWASSMQNYQPLLYQAVKSNPLTANIRVIGPSLAETNVAPSLGDLSGYLDVGNMHNYFGGRNPGSFGWGDGGYGSIPYNLNYEVMVSKNKPIWTTETGYYTTNSPDNINGRYTPRAILEQFNAGIQRTYYYQFSAETTDPAGADGSSLFGLIDANQAPKPQYTALKNLITILSDQGAPFNTGKLNYTIQGAGAQLHHALFQKRNGTFYLALWVEAEGYNVNTQQMEIVAPQNITVTFPTAPKKISELSFADDGTTSNTALTAKSTLAMTVTDDLMFLEITHQ